jgi:DNA repair protein RecO (recombination protein O)
MSDSTLIQTRALLLKKVLHKESDALLTLFTQSHGKLTINARGAQRSTRRFGGALEPMHCLHVEIARGRGDHLELRAAEVALPRLVLTQSLERMEAAGRALGWLRQGAMERDAEPLVWQLVNSRSTTSLWIGNTPAWW